MQHPQQQHTRPRRKAYTPQRILQPPEVSVIVPEQEQQDCSDGRTACTAQKRQKSCSPSKVVASDQHQLSQLRAEEALATQEPVSLAASPAAATAQPDAASKTITASAASPKPPPTPSAAQPPDEPHDPAQTYAALLPAAASLPGQLAAVNDVGGEAVPAVDSARGRKNNTETVADSSLVLSANNLKKGLRIPKAFAELHFGQLEQATHVKLAVFVDGQEIGLSSADPTVRLACYRTVQGIQYYLLGAHQHGLLEYTGYKVSKWTGNKTSISMHLETPHSVDAHTGKHGLAEQQQQVDQQQAREHAAVECIWPAKRQRYSSDGIAAAEAAETAATGQGGSSKCTFASSTLTLTAGNITTGLCIAKLLVASQFPNTPTVVQLRLLIDGQPKDVPGGAQVRIVQMRANQHQVHWGRKAGLLQYTGHKLIGYSCTDGQTLVMHLQSPAAAVDGVEPAAAAVVWQGSQAAVAAADGAAAAPAAEQQRVGRKRRRSAACTTAPSNLVLSETNIKTGLYISSLLVESQFLSTPVEVQVKVVSDGNIVTGLGSQSPGRIAGMGNTGCYQLHRGHKLGLLQFVGHRVLQYECTDGQTVTMHLASPEYAAAVGSGGIPASPLRTPAAAGGNEPDAAVAAVAAAAANESSGSDDRAGCADVAAAAAAAAENAVPSSSWHETTSSRSAPLAVRHKSEIRISRPLFTAAFPGEVHSGKELMVSVWKDGVRVGGPLPGKMHKVAVAVNPPTDLITAVLGCRVTRLRAAAPHFLQIHVTDKPQMQAAGTGVAAALKVVGDLEADTAAEQLQPAAQQQQPHLQPPPQPPPLAAAAVHTGRAEENQHSLEQQQPSATGVVAALLQSASGFNNPPAPSAAAAAAAVGASKKQRGSMRSATALAAFKLQGMIKGKAAAAVTAPAALARKPPSVRHQRRAQQEQGNCGSGDDAAVGTGPNAGYKTPQQVADVLKFRTADVGPARGPTTAAARANAAAGGANQLAEPVNRQAAKVTPQPLLPAAVGTPVTSAGTGTGLQGTPHAAQEPAAPTASATAQSTLQGQQQPAAPPPPGGEQLPAGYVLPAYDNLGDAEDYLRDLLSTDNLHGPDEQLMRLQEAVAALSSLPDGHQKLSRFRRDYKWLQEWVKRRNVASIRAEVDKMLDNALSSS